MATGTLIRILIGVILLIVPGIVSIIFGTEHLLFYLFLLLTPVLFIIEDSCDCMDCWFSSYCEYTKKVKFVKNIFKFLGYDKNKIDAIPMPNQYKTDNSYKEIFKYIKTHV